MTSRLPKVSWLAVVVMAALLSAGCHPGHGGEAAHMTSYETAREGGGRPRLFTVPAQQMPQIQVETVVPRRLERILRFAGQVVYDRVHTVPVLSPIGGPVSRVLVFPGQHVKVGQALLEVKSPDYAQLRASYRKARDAYRVAEANYRRARDLYRHGAIAQQDLLAAGLQRGQSRADMEASAQALRALGLSSPDGLSASADSEDVPLVAPIAGEVVALHCASGQLLQAGSTHCYTISDMSRVWVLIDVPQAQIPFVHVGESATVRTDAFAEPFAAKIAYVASSLDPDTRTLQARMVVKNPQERLKNQMYVTATIDAGVIPDAISLPDSAILRDEQDRPFVYQEAGERRFRRRSVRIGESQGGRTRVLAGVSSGDRVVADGALFLQFQNSLQ